MRQITYLLSPEGHVISRVGSEVAWPILDYENMKPENNFEPRYFLEKIPVLQVARELGRCKGTRKICREIKNYHREFWGFKPLKGD